MLGYEPDGIHRRVVRGALSIERQLRLTRAHWERHRTIAVTVGGLGPYLPLLGLTTV